MDVLISLVKEVSHDFSFWSFFSVKWDIPFLTQSLSKANNQNLRNLSYGIESADIMECPNSSSEYWWKRRRCLPHLSIFTSTFCIKKNTVASTCPRALSVPRSEHFRGKDNGRIFQHIFAPSAGCCVKYPFQIFSVFRSLLKKTKEYREDIPQFYLMHIQTCDPFRLIASERKCLMDFSFIYQQYSR